jgi:hypothetical protein
VTQLGNDRALAMRTLMPRAYSTSTPPATFTEGYAALTRSGRAEVDRLVAAFRQVRREALDELHAGAEQ